MTTFKHYQKVSNSSKQYQTQLNTVKHYWTLLNTIKHYQTQEQELMCRRTSGAHAKIQPRPGSGGLLDARQQTDDRQSPGGTDDPRARHS